MTKLILLCLVVSFNSFAQNLDELTLESKTAPTVVEDESDISLLPEDEPQDAPDSPDVVENVNPETDIPAQLPETSPAELTNKSAGDTPVVEEPATTAEEPTEMADSAPESVPTPNPIADEDQPKEEPKEEPKSIVDQTPPPEFSTPVITTEAPKDDRYINHKKSHWLTTFGFEGLKYELPFEFRGRKKNFKDRDQELYGARLGLGGQLYLGAGFFTTSKVEGYYNGTLFTKIQNAGPEDDDEDVAGLKRTGGIYGAEVSQQLGFILEFRTKNPFMDEWAYLTMEPFVEAGIGVAQAYNSVNYYYDSAGVIDEGYRQKISDKLTNAKIGAGFNLTGRSGFFMYARATVNRYDIIERKTRTYVKQDQQAPVNTKDTIKDAKIDPVTIFALGGGYKF